MKLCDLNKISLTQVRTMLVYTERIADLGSELLLLRL